MHTHTPEHTRELTQAAAQAEAAVDFLYIMVYLSPKGKAFFFCTDQCATVGENKYQPLSSQLSLFLAIMTMFLFWGKH